MMHVLPPPIVSGALEMESAMTSVTVKPRMTGCVLITTLVVLLFSLAIFAQANFGRILGRVTDPTGAVLPGASISIVDTQRGLARTVTTDEAGSLHCFCKEETALALTVISGSRACGYNHGSPTTGIAGIDQ